MAYICSKKSTGKILKCQDCIHYRCDKEYGDYVCWAKHDELLKQAILNSTTTVK